MSVSVWCHTGDEEGDVYEGDVALAQTGSDEPVDMLGYSIVSTFARVAPVMRKVTFMRVMMPCPWTGSDELVNSVVSTSGPGGPGGPCDEEGDVYEGGVALPRTGSDEPVNSVVSTIDPGGPGDETGSVVDTPGDAIVVPSECRKIDRGTLDNYTNVAGQSPVGVKSVSWAIPQLKLTRGACL